MSQSQCLLALSCCPAACCCTELATATVKNKNSYGNKKNRSNQSVGSLYSGFFNFFQVLSLIGWIYWNGKGKGSFKQNYTKQKDTLTNGRTNKRTHITIIQTILLVAEVKVWVEKLRTWRFIISSTRYIPPFPGHIHTMSNWAKLCSLSTFSNSLIWLDVLINVSTSSPHRCLWGASISPPLIYGLEI